MSKMDDLRAMREARYAQTTTRATPTRTSPPAASAPAAAPKKAPRPAPAPKAPTAEAPAAEAAGQLCGHRAISGRTCTREHGHAAKSHRYA